MPNSYSSIKEALSRHNLHQDYDQGDRVIVYYDDLYDMRDQLRVLRDLVSDLDGSKEIFAELERLTNRDINKII